ncbi:hypothetical protein M413DRAFT_447997 [Hebeloma cylindrosporum]|uniref:Uncharacterized protein n=1 Tax=Hebeloma cylindrosporum TaxID=76867 RepID=A0A0C2XKH9_HEBCY|nr:hypothetical protein M413DRAFT_447997 [Hebeloma cylindrosporum h7]
MKASPSECFSLLRLDQCTMQDGNRCSACAEDIVMEEQLNELEKMAEKIRTKRRVLRTVMNQNHDRLIHRFPPEIASRIFFHHCRDSLRLNKKENLDALTLGAVCQKWRQLAWATPELWTSIDIWTRMLHCSTHAEVLCAEWLQRSATLPLTVRFTDPHAFESDSGRLVYDGVYRTVAELLNRQSARWYDIQLSIPAPYIHRLCGSSQSSILRRLSLSIGRWSNFPTLEPTFSMEVKPCPSELELFFLSPKCVDINWNNLTVLSLNSIRADEVIEVLLWAPNLTTVTFVEIEPHSETFHVPNTRVYCPHVHYLEIMRVGYDAFGTLLDLVQLPSLEQWTIESCGFPLENMVPFVEASSFCLKTCNIGGHHTPGITKLRTGKNLVQYVNRIF